MTTTASMIMLGVYIYIGVMFWLLFVVSVEWIVEADVYQMCFKRPWTVRASTGMLGLAFFIGAVAVAVLPPSPSIPWGLALVCLLISGLMFYFSGPKDVRIDLDKRTCCETYGWMLFPKKFTCSLSKTSRILVYSGGSGSYVVLWIDGLKDPKFTLAVAARMSEALKFADKVAIPLQLPVKQTTLTEMREWTSRGAL